MNWCERCGRWYIVGTFPVRYVKRGIGARGMFQEPGTGVCPGCLHPNEAPYD